MNSASGVPLLKLGRTSRKYQDQPFKRDLQDLTIRVCLLTKECCRGMSPRCNFSFEQTLKRSFSFKHIQHKKCATLLLFYFIYASFSQAVPNTSVTENRSLSSNTRFACLITHQTQLQVFQCKWVTVMKNMEWIVCKISMKSDFNFTLC